MQSNNQTYQVNEVTPNITYEISEKQDNSFDNYSSSDQFEDEAS